MVEANCAGMTIKPDIAGYEDPRLALIYDLDNPAGPDHDFFRSQAAETDARRIVDLGCGTGLLPGTLTVRDVRSRESTRREPWSSGPTVGQAPTESAGSAAPLKTLKRPQPTVVARRR